MILVTGGAGFIGSALVQALIDRGERVRVFDNFSRGNRTIPPGVNYVHGDIRLVADLLPAVSGCDEVIHLAYINGTKNFYERPAEVLDVGVRGMLNILDGCKAHKIKRFALMSSSEVCRARLVDTDETIPLVIPDPFNPRYSYSAGKIISEMLAIHNAKLFDRLLIARPFNIYGPGMAQGHVIPDFMEKLRKLNGKTEFEVMGKGNETRSFCYIDDFIDGFMLMREKGAHMGIYNIGMPVETTIGELARKMADIAGYDIEIKQADKLREGDALRRKPDIGKLAALGYRPKVNLDEGLRRTIDAMPILQPAETH